MTEIPPSGGAQRVPGAGPAGTPLPRVGHISFLNCLPIYWGLRHTGALERFDLVQDTPDRLSSALIRGDLAMGPISLAEYLRHPEGLLLLPDLAVGSDGEVMSVNLVSTRPLEELDGRTVALGSTSRTSVVLARMLLEDRMGLRPHWVTRPPDLAAMLQDADAAVLIGDPALRASLGGAAELGTTVHDLGAAWKDWTGRPMIFAVWAVREEWYRGDPEAVRAAHQAFVDSRDLAVANADRIAAEAAAAGPFAPEDLTRYFRALDFRLGETQLAGVREFAARAAGRLGSPAEPELAMLESADA